MTFSLNSIQETRIGVAFSGGAVRGLAHIGVIKVLQEVGIKPAVIAGTSAGSIIGAALSAGMDWRDLAAMARSVFWPSLLHGPSLETFSRQYLPETFEHLETPFAAVVTMVPSGRPLTITSGPLPSAISASCALRLLRRPVIRDGLKLKDGGFTCVLPTHACRNLGSDFVIASDVWEWSAMMRSVGCSPLQTPRVFPAHYRFALSHTDIHIHPEIPVSGYIPGTLAVNRMIAVGERAAQEALESLFKEQAA
jgi:NTE family protein